MTKKATGYKWYVCNSICWCCGRYGAQRAECSCTDNQHDECGACTICCTCKVGAETIPCG